MTTELLLEIVRLRLQGHPVERIAADLGIREDQVQQGMRRVMLCMHKNRVGQPVKIIYPAIKERLLERGMYMGDLAELSGVHLNTLYLIMRGATGKPRDATKRRIADALGIPVDVAFERKEGKACR